MFNSTELTNEYNLLNDFLTTSLLDDSLYQSEPNQTNSFATDPSIFNNMAPTNNLTNSSFAASPAPNQNGYQMPAVSAAQTPRASNTAGSEKAKESYFMEAADPSGAAPPEERMNKLLQAKYNAGLLKPFNYVSGYARLGEWMSKNLQPGNKNRITAQFNKFRPKFRQKIQNLTDIQLVQVEMWFERELMQYDRVFASMAIPACCWRRTGEIYRGNREMSELLGLEHVESLRDVCEHLGPNFSFEY